MLISTWWTPSSHFLCHRAGSIFPCSENKFAKHWRQYMVGTEKAFRSLQYATGSEVFSWALVKASSTLSKYPETYGKGPWSHCALWARHVEGNILPSLWSWAGDALRLDILQVKAQICWLLSSSPLSLQCPSPGCLSQNLARKLFHNRNLSKMANPHPRLHRPGATSVPCLPRCRHQMATTQTQGQNPWLAGLNPIQI